MSFIIMQLLWGLVLPILLVQCVLDYKNYKKMSKIIFVNKRNINRDYFFTLICTLILIQEIGNYRYENMLYKGVVLTAITFAIICSIVKAVQRKKIYTNGILIKESRVNWKDVKSYEFIKNKNGQMFKLIIIADYKVMGRISRDNRITFKVNNQDVKRLKELLVKSVDS